MPLTFSASCGVRTSYTLSDPQVIGTAGETAQLRSNRDVQNGTGPNQANAAWRQRVTVSSGQVYSIDLTNLGATVFGFGGKVSLSTLKEVFVVVSTASAAYRILWGVISPADTTAYAAALGPGSDYRWSDYSVGVAINASNKNIYVANPANSGGEATFDLMLVGVGTYIDT